MSQDSNKIYFLWKQLSNNTTINKGATSREIENLTKDKDFIHECLQILKNQDYSSDLSFLMFTSTLLKNSIIVFIKEIQQNKEYFIYIRNILTDILYYQSLNSKLKNLICISISILITIDINNYWENSIQKLIELALTEGSFLPSILDIFSNIFEEINVIQSKVENIDEFEFKIEKMKKEIFIFINRLLTNSGICDSFINKKITKILQNLCYHEISNKLTFSSSSKTDYNIFTSKLTIKFLSNEILNFNSNGNDDGYLNEICLFIENSIKSYYSNYNKKFAISDFSPLKLNHQLNLSLELENNDILVLLSTIEYLINDYINYNDLRRLLLSTKILTTLIENMPFILFVNENLSERIFKILNYLSSTNRNITNITLTIIKPTLDYVLLIQLLLNNKIKSSIVHEFKRGITQYLKNILYSSNLELNNHTEENYSKFKQNNFEVESLEDLEPDFQMFSNYNYDEENNNTDLSVIEFRKISSNSIKDTFMILLYINKETEVQYDKINININEINENIKAETNWLQEFFNFSQNNFELFLFSVNSISDCLFEFNNFRSINNEITKLVISQTPQSSFMEKLEIIKWFSKISLMLRSSESYFDLISQVINSLLFILNDSCLSLLCLTYINELLRFYFIDKEIDLITNDDKALNAWSIYDKMVQYTLKNENLYYKLSNSSIVEVYKSLIILINLQESNDMNDNLALIRKIIQFSFDFIDYFITNDVSKLTREFIILNLLINHISEIKVLSKEIKYALLSQISHDIIIHLLSKNSTLISLSQHTDNMQALSLLFTKLVNLNNIIYENDDNTKAVIHDLFYEIFMKNEAAYHSGLLLIILYKDKITTNIDHNDLESNMAFFSSLIQMINRINSNFKYYSNNNNFIGNYVDFYNKILSCIDIEIIGNSFVTSIKQLLDAFTYNGAIDREVFKKHLNLYTNISKVNSKTCTLLTTIIITRCLKKFYFLHSMFQDHYPKYEVNKFILVASTFNKELFLNILSCLIDSENDYNIFKQAQIKSSILTNFQLQIESYNNDENSSDTYYLKFISKFISVLNGSCSLYDYLLSLSN